ncbi:MAG: hypothetical protein M0R51_09695 [Clostridia bacterium]|jgi:hypothetical protein|nr:hypothetical protein [Clostridia bacterium]
MKQISLSCALKFIKHDCKMIGNYFIKLLNYIWSIFFVVIWFFVPICYFVWMFITKTYETSCFIEFIILSALAVITSSIGLVCRDEGYVVKRRYPDGPLADTFLCLIAFGMLLIISTVLFAFDIYWGFAVIGVLGAIIMYVRSLYSRCSEKEA